jgi:predicted AlkP superfamily phosphohydrolase/phosphomutase
MELLVLGLDGLSFNMLERFGLDPEYLSAATESGVSGDLTSVDTPTTLPAWTSFATGKDPGSHGRTNMIRTSPNYEQRTLEPNTTDAAAYDLLDDAVFVNLPASIGRVPAGENSHLVAAMMASDEADAVPEYMQDLDAFDDYVLDHDKALKARPEAYFDHVCEITRARRAFAREAFERYDPRVGFCLFSTPDWAGHLLSNFSDDETRGGYYGRLIETVDDCVADLAAMADNVVLMSDHGFEYKHTNVHLGDWLRDEGYLVAAEADDASPLARLAVDATKRVASRSDWLYERVRQVYNYIIATDVGQGLQEAATTDVDYPNSRAWQLRYGCVYVNDDRFDSPTVDDPEALTAELRERIADLTDDDGDPLFRAVLTAEEAYRDPGEWAPDVIARPAPGCYPTTLDSPTGGYASPTNNFNHRYRGLFVATGPAFGEGSVEGMSVVDVLPTVMAALGESLSPEFDGEARTDVLAGDPSVTFLDPDAVPRPRTRDDESAARADREEAVAERLADLGYLE